MSISFSFPKEKLMMNTNKTDSHSSIIKIEDIFKGDVKCSFHKHLDHKAALS